MVSGYLPITVVYLSKIFHPRRRVILPEEWSQSMRMYVQHWLQVVYTRSERGGSTPADTLFVGARYMLLRQNFQVWWSSSSKETNINNVQSHILLTRHIVLMTLFLNYHVPPGTVTHEHIKFIHCTTHTQVLMKWAPKNRWKRVEMSLGGWSNIHIISLGSLAPQGHLPWCIIWYVQSAQYGIK